MIASAGAAQTIQILDNNSFNNTLDTTAMSTATGQSPTVTTSWSFNGVDEWQHIVVSLRP